MKDKREDRLDREGWIQRFAQTVFLLLLFLLRHLSCWRVVLLSSCHSRLPAPEPVLGDTPNLLSTAYIPPGGAGTPVQPHCVPVVTQNYRQIRREQLFVSYTCESIRFSGLSYCLLYSAPVVTFIHTKAGETDSQSLMLPNGTDWYPWGLTDLYCDD